MYLVEIVEFQRFYSVKSSLMMMRMRRNVWKVASLRVGMVVLKNGISKMVVGLKESK